jgi:hypothetical protein
MTARVEIEENAINVKQTGDGFLDIRHLMVSMT